MTSVVRREVVTPDQRLAWPLVLATIPVGIAGLALEHLFRTTLGRPVPTAVFLVLDGFVLLAGERLAGRAIRRGAEVSAATGEIAAATGEGSAAGGLGGQRAGAAQGPASVVDRRLSRPGVGRAVLVGAAQIVALLPGISRSGTAMVTGLATGLPRGDAARFSFLLATPVIPRRRGARAGRPRRSAGRRHPPPGRVGSILSGVGAYLSVRFLTRYFEHRSLRPFELSCIAAGAACLVWFAVR